MVKKARSQIGSGQSPKEISESSVLSTFFDYVCPGGFKLAPDRARRKLQKHAFSRRFLILFALSGTCGFEVFGTCCMRMWQKHVKNIGFKANLRNSASPLWTPGRSSEKIEKKACSQVGSGQSPEEIAETYVFSTFVDT